MSRKFLANKVQNLQECDASKDAITIKASLKKNIKS